MASVDPSMRSEDPWAHMEEDGASSGDLGCPTTAGAFEFSSSKENYSEISNGEFTKYFRDVTEYHIEFLRDRKKRRGDVLKWAMLMTTSFIILSAIFMLLYVISQWGGINPIVMSGWLVSLGAQTIGILLVIVKFLFPPNDHGVEGIIGKQLEDRI